MACARFCWPLEYHGRSAPAAIASISLVTVRHGSSCTPNNDLCRFFGLEARNQPLRTAFIPNTALVRPLGYDTGYKPDVLMVDSAALAQEPLWQRESVITQASSVKLLVDVVSTNWPDDYARKFEDYEAMGIAEYWIVDYKGLGGRRYIGFPKQPTITICTWVNGLYETRLVRQGDRLASPLFPSLTLTAAEIFQAAA